MKNFRRLLSAEAFIFKFVAFNVKEQAEQNIKCDIEVRVDVKTVHAVKTFLGDLNRHPGKTQIVRLDSILDLKTQLPRKTP